MSSRRKKGSLYYQGFEHDRSRSRSRDHSRPRSYSHSRSRSHSRDNAEEIHHLPYEYDNEDFDMISLDTFTTFSKQKISEQFKLYKINGKKYFFIRSGTINKVINRYGLRYRDLRGGFYNKTKSKRTKIYKHRSGNFTLSKKL